MKAKFWPARTEERRATILAGLILLQAVCALFFTVDVIEDYRHDGQLDGPHMILESIAAVALIGGVIFLMVELRRLLQRMAVMQTGLEVARGNLADVIDAFFEEWQLTNAERDVALMILKGFDNEAIAGLRHTAAGTVRAQATNIYAKSATDGRAQFISLFMEELLAGDIGTVAPHAGDSSKQGATKEGSSPVG